MWIFTENRFYVKVSSTKDCLGHGPDHISDKTNTEYVL